jgi:hypothetical protein
MPHVPLQVNRAKGAMSTKLLRQLETHLLLHLVLLQLTASIPDSFPGAQPARDMVCRLKCESLYDLFYDIEKRCVRLHQHAPYMGPQLALQLLPLPPSLYPLPSGLPQQQQQQQQQQQWEKGDQPEGGKQRQHEQPAEWRLVAPSADLLTELLPLLVRHCRTQLQQHESATLPTQLSPLVQLLLALLLCSVVPATSNAATEGSPPPLPLAATAAAPVVTAASVAEIIPTREGRSNSEAAFSCELHAKGVFLPHAGDIISILEGSLRLVACYAAATTTAATATAAGAAGAAAQKAAAIAAAACDSLCRRGG